MDEDPEAPEFNQIWDLIANDFDSSRVKYFEENFRKVLYKLDDPAMFVLNCIMHAAGTQKTPGTVVTASDKPITTVDDDLSKVSLYKTAHSSSSASNQAAESNSNCHSIANLICNSLIRSLRNLPTSDKAIAHFHTFASNILVTKALCPVIFQNLSRRIGISLKMDLVSQYVAHYINGTITDDGQFLLTKVENPTKNKPQIVAVASLLISQGMAAKVFPTAVMKRLIEIDSLRVLINFALEVVVVNKNVVIEFVQWAYEQGYNYEAANIADETHLEAEFPQSRDILLRKKIDHSLARNLYELAARKCTSIHLKRYFLNHLKEQDLFQKVKRYATRWKLNMEFSFTNKEIREAEERRSRKYLALPTHLFDSLLFVNSPKKLKEAIKLLYRPWPEDRIPLIGLDCEWRADFYHNSNSNSSRYSSHVSKKDWRFRPVSNSSRVTHLNSSPCGDRSNILSILQIARFDAVVIVDILAFEEEMLAGFIKDLFLDTNICKVGFSFDDDRAMLGKSFPAFPAVADIFSFLELEEIWSHQLFSKRKGSQNGLKDLVMQFSGKPLDKSEQTSDWNMRPLSRPQLKYAGLDAYVCVEIAELMLQQITKHKADSETDSSSSTVPEKDSNERLSGLLRQDSESDSTPEQQSPSSAFSLEQIFQTFKMFSFNCVQGHKVYLRQISHTNIIHKSIKKVEYVSEGNQIIETSLADEIQGSENIPNGNTHRFSFDDKSPWTPLSHAWANIGNPLSFDALASILKSVNLNPREHLIPLSSLPSLELLHSKKFIQVKPLAFNVNLKRIILILEEGSLINVKLFSLAYGVHHSQVRLEPASNCPPLYGYPPGFCHQKCYETYIDERLVAKLNENDCLLESGYPEGRLLLSLQDLLRITGAKPLPLVGRIEEHILPNYSVQSEDSTIAPRFVVEHTLASLGRWLRCAGIDTEICRDPSVRSLIYLANKENRIVLTASWRFAQQMANIPHLLCRRSDERTQLHDVMKSYKIHVTKSTLLSRCTKCNGLFEVISTETAAKCVPKGVLATFKEFWKCNRCNNVVWQGKKFESIRQSFIDIYGPVH